MWYHMVPLGGNGLKLKVPADIKHSFSGKYHKLETFWTSAGFERVEKLATLSTLTGK